jgi:hypothetical protein
MGILTSENVKSYVAFAKTPDVSPPAEFIALFPNTVDSKIPAMAYHQYGFMTGWAAKFSKTRSTWYGQRARQAEDLLNSLMLYYSNSPTMYRWVDYIDPTVKDGPDFPPFPPLNLT